jgi:predicted RNA-binding protein YlxR (DUF448 family)
MGRGKGHIPIRTCVSCRAKRAKKDLIRLSLSKEGELTRDMNGKMQGRGAYVCRNGSCLDKLINNKYLCRVFRTDKVIVDSRSWGTAQEKQAGKSDSNDFGGIDGES